MIISCGEALVDVLPSGQVVPGGGPMNAAIAAARLGGTTAFLGRISTDEAGQMIWAHLQRSGVDLSAAQRGPEPTARAIVTTVPVQSFRFEGEGTADCSMTSIDCRSLGPGPHVVHGGTLGIFRGSTAEVLARWVESTELDNSLISFDPNVRPQIIGERKAWTAYADRWLARADLVKGSDEDFDWMGVTPEQLLERGPSIVLRTIGADGVEAFLANGDRLTVPGVRVEVVDTVGAGDSFCGAILLRLHQIQEAGSSLGDLDLTWWQRTLEFAVRVAAITVSRPGADPPWAEELPDDERRMTERG